MTDPAAMAAERCTGRVVALDVGRARIGVAVSDVATGMALPHAVLERQGTRVDLTRLQQLFAPLRPDVLVVGLPPQDDDAPQGQGAASAGLCRRFAQALAAAVPLPVWLVDEADTTTEAHNELRALGMRAARRRREVDKVAAARILDRFLAGAVAERIEPLAGGGEPEYPAR
jgi:putative Holliday junction resolvase